MDLSAFQQWLLGSGQAGGAGQNVPDQTANVSAPALQQATMQNHLSHLGQMGALLMAAGQRMTGAQRANILAQAPQYMDFSQDGINAVRQQAANMSLNQAQREDDRKRKVSEMFKDPAMLQSLGVNAEQATVLGDEGLQKIYEAKLSRDPMAAAKNLLEVQKLQNEVKNYKDPVQLELEKKQADEKAKLDAGNAASMDVLKKDVMPTFNSLKAAYKDAIDHNAVSRLQGSDWWRDSLGSSSPQEAYRQRYEQAREAWIAQETRRVMAKQGQITEGERERIQKQAPPINSVEPQMALDQFSHMYDQYGAGEPAQSLPPSGQAKVLRRIR